MGHLLDAGPWPIKGASGAQSAHCRSRFSTPSRRQMDFVGLHSGDRRRTNFFGWEGDSITEGPWRPIGVTEQADARWGENAVGPNPESGTVPGSPAKNAQRWRGPAIQAPYFMKWGDEFLCFYNSSGIRVMTSRDGKNFTRRGAPPDGNLHYADGGRDVMVLPFDGVLYAYSTISTTNRRGYIMLRTSTDLKNWTPGKNVNEGGPGGAADRLARKAHSWWHSTGISTSSVPRPKPERPTYIVLLCRTISA